jgi:hypothetical protein
MKIMSIALLVLGIGLTIWGYQLSDSVGSQVTKLVTGSNPDKVMTLYISGAVSCIVGIYLFVKK